MLLAEFVQKYVNKYVNFDTVYGPQCMDLYRQYVKEVLELPQSVGVRGAADVWTKYPVEHYDRTANTPDNFPLPGDIVIWRRWYSLLPVGHIAIAVSADRDRLVCFSQNDPGGRQAGLKEYGYKNILGWLHPKD